MASRSISISAANPQVVIDAQDCEASRDACGEQQCLTRPRFFCGQLLTDQDLGALSEWAQEKHRLDRHKHGWGVVSGLQVRCDSQNPGRVVVDSGYAVDPCGNDIVVCEPGVVDLSSVCPTVEKPCNSFEQEYDWEPVFFMGLNLPPGQVIPVDLFVSYQEVPESPLPALGRGACSERDACEYSRVREHHAFDWRPADDGQSFVRRLKLWERNYFLDCSEVVDAFMDKFKEYLATDDNDYDDGGRLSEVFDEVREWLLERVETRPPREFCFLRDAILTLSPHSNDLEAEVSRILFFLVQDCRNEYLQQYPRPASDHAGVPVARVWMFQPEDESGCRVIHIDDFPTPREQWGNNTWPAPDGAHNLGRHVWQQASQVCLSLHDLGYCPRKFEVDIPTRVMELQAILQQDVTGEEGERYQVGLIWPLSCGGESEAQFSSLDCGDEIGVAVIRDQSPMLDDRVFAFFVSKAAVYTPERPPEEAGKPETGGGVRPPVGSPGKPGAGGDVRPPVGSPVKPGPGDDIRPPVGSPGKPGAGGGVIRPPVILPPVTRPGPITIPGIIRKPGRLKAGIEVGDTIKRAEELRRVEKAAPKARTGEKTRIAAAKSKTEDTDMLETINGIGETRAFKLRQNGIRTFEQLAAMTTDELRKLFPRVRKNELQAWLKQAGKLAK